MKDRFAHWLRRPPSKDTTVEVVLLLGMSLGLSLYDGTWDWLRPIAWLMTLSTCAELLRRAVRHRRARQAL
ncbi:hypothetical protein [Streptomyces sp. NPDC058486]|uniref:hypothetical protein n=1 Tax=unclassified Streptomyces TaxID=2593676 RepID=UPI003663E020